MPEESTEAVIGEDPAEGLPSFEAFAAAMSEASEEAQEAPQEPSGSPQAAQATPPPTPAPQPVSEAPSEQERRFLERAAEKERELQDRRTELERQRTEMDARLAKIKEWEDFERKLSEEDVLGALESRGWSLEELAAAAVQNRGAAPLRRLEQEMKRQKEELEGQLKAFKAEREQEQAKQLQAQAWAEVGEQIKTRSPLLAAAGDVGQSAVWELAFAERQPGQPTNYDALVSRAEGQLVTLLEKILSVPENRQRFLGSASPKEQQATPAPRLSNSVASQVTRRSPPPNLDDLSRDAAIDELFKGGSLFDSLT